MEDEAATACPSSSQRVDGGGARGSSGLRLRGAPSTPTRGQGGAAADLGASLRAPESVDYDADWKSGDELSDAYESSDEPPESRGMPSASRAMRMPDVRGTTTTRQ